MILKVIVVVVLFIWIVYNIYKVAILESKNDELLLENRIKDAHIKRQIKEIRETLEEVESLREELKAVYWCPKKNPNNHRSEILLLRSRWLTMREIWEKVWLSKSTISKYLKIWDSETRWSQKYPRPVMPKNKSLFQ